MTSATELLGCCSHNNKLPGQKGACYSCTAILVTRCVSPFYLFCRRPDSTGETIIMAQADELVVTVLGC